MLGLITALIVARPLVPGEDPGRLLLGTGVSGPTFTLLWLLAGAGWAVWRAWSRRDGWRGSLVEFGLVGLAIVAFFSAGHVATYQYPAWLSAWEWVGLLVAFCLVRQLTRGDDENRALLAAVLATGVSLSVYAVYQLRQPEPLPAVSNDIVRQIFDLPDEPAPRPDGSAATFAHPASFAAYLALLLPALIGAALASWQAEQWSWRTGLTAGCCLLLGIGLFLANGWAALLALVLVGTVTLLLWGRGQPGFLLMGFVSLASIVVLTISFAGVEHLKELLHDRLETWDASAAMIREHAILGVGPGNFGREYPHYLPLLSSHADAAAHPHNFLFEIAATLGVGALALLVLTLAAFFWRVSSATQPEVKDEEPRHGRRVNWEFYLGGVCGLMFGFMLRFAEQGGQNALIEALVALCRSLVWFGAFALLEGIVWSGRIRVRALTAGVAALLLALLFTDGISFPALALPLWVMAALALNSAPAPTPAWTPSHWLGWMLPAPLLVGVGVFYLVFIFYPAASAASSVSEARRYYPAWPDKEAEWRHKVEEGSSQEEKVELVRKADRVLKEAILGRLEYAVAEDPNNALLWTELAFWYGKQWELYGMLKEADFPNLKVQAQIKEQMRKISLSALGAAWRHDPPGPKGAQELDPKGKEGYWIAYRLRMLFSTGTDPRKPEQLAQQIQQYQMAANYLTKVAEIEPHNTRVRFLLAEAFFKAGNVEDGKRWAQEAQKLDEQTDRAENKLTDAQRKQVWKWTDLGGVR